MRTATRAASHARFKRQPTSDDSGGGFESATAYQARRPLEPRPTLLFFRSFAEEEGTNVFRFVDETTYRGRDWGRSHQLIISVKGLFSVKFKDSCFGSVMEVMLSNFHKQSIGRGKPTEGYTNIIQRAKLTGA